ncbi:MAG: PEP-CTERM sorting domain-containing protein [Akkermansia sp.]|nr:PEP-CTERM sorting domain-containing protein [Akkermansia sp.]
MKKTLYLSILAAALTGSQMFAEDFIPTTTDATPVDYINYAGAYSETADVSGENVTINEETEGGDDFSQIVITAGETTGEGKTASHNSITMTGGQVAGVYGGASNSGKAEYNTATITGGIAIEVYGATNWSGNVTNNTATASGGEVTRLYGGQSQSGEVSNNTASVSAGHIYDVNGGQSKFGNASNNTVTVSGGLVDNMVTGGNAQLGGNATNNTVNITGGQVGLVYGGYGNDGAANNSAIVTGGQVGGNVVGGECWTGSANGNTVVLSGCIVGGNVTAGSNYTGDEASNNHVYLLGKGASAVIGGKAYTGGDQGVTVAGYVAGYHALDGATTTGNSIEVYGTAITAATLCGTQMVNFHIADGVLLSQEAMVSLTSTSDGEGLDLTGVELGFNAADVQDWAAYEGQSITLVKAAQSITIDQGSLGDVAIKDANGLTVATATLALGGSDDVLSLSNIKGTAPVPEPTTGTLSLLALAGLCIRRRRK